MLIHHPGPVFFQEQRGVDTFAIRARQHASPALLHRLELFHRRWLDRVSLGAMVTTKQREQQMCIRDRYGLDVELVTFNDYVLPNEALSKGDIDVNAFQHKPYLDQQIKDRGYKLVAVGNTFVYPIAGYSKKIKSLDELQPGSQIAVPNDPTNLGRDVYKRQPVSHRLRLSASP